MAAKVNMPELLGMVEAGNLEEVRRLLTAGANPDIRETERAPNVNPHDMRNLRTPLIIAAEKGFTDIAKELLDAGANPNMTDTYNKNTPLIVAAQRNNVELVKALLAKGANPDIKNAYMNTALSSAVLTRDPAPTFKALLDGGADPNLYTGYGSYIINSVAVYKNKDLLTLLFSSPRFNLSIPIDGEKTIGQLAKEGRYSSEINKFILDAIDRREYNIAIGNIPVPRFIAAINKNALAPRRAAAAAAAAEAKTKALREGKSEAEAERIAAVVGRVPTILNIPKEVIAKVLGNIIGPSSVDPYGGKRRMIRKRHTKKVKRVRRRHTSKRRV